MRKLIVLLSVLATSFSAFAADKVQASDETDYRYFDQISGFHRAYSKATDLNVNVIELLAGDGMNSSRMVLTLTADYTQAPHIYELPAMMEEVTRVTFLAQDVIVINYKQNTCKNEECLETIDTDKSMKITVGRDAKNQLTSEISVEDLK